MNKIIIWPVSIILLILLMISCSEQSGPTGSGVIQDDGSSSLSKNPAQSGGNDGYTISGTVFVDLEDEDGEANGMFDDDESGLKNVLVRLERCMEDDQPPIPDAITNNDGSYCFSGLEAGCYIITIPATLDDNSLLNNNLTEYYIATGPLSIQVTIPSNEGENEEEVDDPMVLNENNFGFKQNTEKVLDDLENNTLETNGEDFKYWRKLLLHAWNGNPNVNIEEVRGYLLDIEELLLDRPYKFEGNKFKEAYEIVRKNKPKTLPEQLEKELLVTELNYVKGIGIAENPGLQLSLIAWGESLVAALENNGNNKAGTPALNAVSDQQIRDAVRVFQIVNIGSGGDE